MPFFSAVFLIVTLSSIGLPFTNGFVGEFLVLLGVFKLNTVYGVIATSGIVFSACYMLWMYQRVVYGKVTNPENEKLLDLSPREKTIMIPLVVLIFWIGIYPKPLFEKMEPAITEVVQKVGRAKTAALERQEGIDIIVAGRVAAETENILTYSEGGIK